MALMKASRNGYFEILNILIANQVDKYGKTALMFASETCNLQVVNLLLKYKADINQVKDGITFCI